MLKETIENQQLFPVHEHIGSLTSFGFRPDNLFPSDVTPDLQPERTGLVELFFSPYLSSLMFENGAVFPLPEDMVDEKYRVRTIKALLIIFQKTIGTGLWEALIIAFRNLYQCDLTTLMDDDTEILRIDNQIAINYSNYYEWIENVMTKSKTIYVLKPVHPEFLVHALRGDGVKESAFSSPILRVDSLVGFPDEKKILDFGGITQASGIEINDIDSLDKSIEWFFDLVDQSKCKSIKQLQAYYRPISIENVTRDQACQAFREIITARGSSLKVNQKTIYTLQDYTLRRILEEAQKRMLPYQIHTGMATLKYSNPGLLEDLFKKYPNVKFVLLHTYPFVSEAAYLARTYPNVYLDTSWQALQSSAILKKCLNEWVGMVPFMKITASVDATNIEEYYGGQQITRRVLCDILQKRIQEEQIDQKVACEIAKSILCDNARRLYT